MSSTPAPLTEEEVGFIERYRSKHSPYASRVARVERDIAALAERVSRLRGVTPSDTGLLPPERWDLASDVAALADESDASLVVGEVTRALPTEEAEAEGDPYALPPDDDPVGAPSPPAPRPPRMHRYVVNVPNDAKYVVGLHETLSPVDVSEGQRVGLDRAKLAIRTPLPVRLDACIGAMEVVDRPETTFADIGGCDDQIERIREVVELPFTHPERFARLGVEPPKGVLFSGPPGCGKTLCARAVAGAVAATFVKVTGSELSRRYIGQGAHLIREIFALARSKRACVLFFDEVDAFAATRLGGEGEGEDLEANRTLLEFLNQLDGFDGGSSKKTGNVKTLMATNRAESLDPALMRPGRVDRVIEFGLPDFAGRCAIFRAAAGRVANEPGVRLELLARLCRGCTGADIACVVREAGMFAIRRRKKGVGEGEYLSAVEKVVTGTEAKRFLGAAARTRAAGAYAL